MSSPISVDSREAFLKGESVPRDKIKVLIVDDHPVFREGLRQCLQARKELQLLAAVGSGEEMWRAFRTHGRPQIILMDVEMPGQGGIELTQALHEKHPDIRVIMVTAFSDSERVFAALKAGAVGYLLKNVTPDEICATVKRASTGEPMLSGEIAGRVLREFEREREEDRYREKLAGLTAREEEILKLLATGESNREIGKRLFISEQTVKNHVANIFRKLQVNDRTKAALLAVKLGLGGDSTR
jgi:RNA polymerase sigma factor (sigma-70 family)